MRLNVQSEERRRGENSIRTHLLRTARATTVLFLRLIITAERDGYVEFATAITRAILSSPDDPNSIVNDLCRPSCFFPHSLNRVFTHYCNLVRPFHSLSALP